MAIERKFKKNRNNNTFNEAVEVESAYHGTQDNIMDQQNPVHTDTLTTVSPPNPVRELVNELFPLQDDYIVMVAALLDIDLNTTERSNVEYLCVEKSKQVCSDILKVMGEGFSRSAHKIEELNQLLDEQKKGLDLVTKNMQDYAARASSASAETAVVRNKLETKESELKKALGDKSALLDLLAEAKADTTNMQKGLEAMKSLKYQAEADRFKMMAAPPVYQPVSRSSFLETAVTTVAVAAVVVGVGYAGKIAFEHFFGDDAGEGSDS